MKITIEINPDLNGTHCGNCEKGSGPVCTQFDLARRWLTSIGSRPKDGFHRIDKCLDAEEAYLKKEK